MICRTSSSRISAAVPGSVSRPAAFRRCQVGLQIEAERGGALPDLQRRERVHVHVRHRGLHRVDDVDVRVAGVLRVNAALHADLGGAARPGFRGAALNLLVGEIVGAAAQVLRQLALGEGAELALEIADIGVVDVAVDDEADGVAVHRGAHAVGGLHHGAEVVAAGGEQPHHVGFAEILAGCGAVENRRYVGGHPLRRGADRASTSAGGSICARAPGVGARHAFGIHQLEHPLVQTGIDPAVELAHEARVDGQALEQVLAGSGGFPGQLVQVRPRRFRIDEVRGQRRHAAPVVDAGGDDLRQHAGAEIGRRLNAHVGAEQDARHGDGPQQFVEIGLRRVRHLGFRLGAEVLNDDFLDVAVALVDVADGQQRFDAFRRVSPMPMRMPVVNGTPASPAAPGSPDAPRAPCPVSRSGACPSRTAGRTATPA
jgi:hypothetical protein